MMDTQTNPTNAESYIREVQSRVEQAGDREVAERIGDLADRLASGATAVTVAFCGLFSAGKSSLMNALIGSEQLATGAVPTTAEVAELPLPDADDAVRLLDTPGVDSTDAAHQAATEAALHRADVIALVMDYQHVETESNLELARAFCEQRKRLLLVINQVDKHVDWELPFTDFQDRLLRTLEDWDVAPERIFYTATLPSEHNQLEELRGYLQGLAATSQPSVVERVFDGLRDLAAQHIDRQMVDRQDELTSRFANVGLPVPYDRAEAEAMRQRLETDRTNRLASLTTAIEALQKEQEGIREQMQRMVDLAQISPYDTTEFGRFYIESLRPDFRPGWFRARQRALEEQTTRLQRFIEALGERTVKYLVWPVQSSLRELAKDVPWVEDEWLTDVDRVNVEVTAEGARKSVKSGALVSEQYPYQYVKDVVSEIKRAFSVRLTELLDDWFARAVEELQQRQAEDTASVNGLTDQIAVIDAWLQLAADREAALSQLLQGEEETAQ